MLKSLYRRVSVVLVALLSVPSLALAAPQKTEDKAPKPAASQKKPEGKKKATAEKSVVLNKATQEQLQTLPGIGAATAERILAFRKDKGKFTDISQLLEIKGIGEKKLAKIRPLVTLD